MKQNNIILLLFGTVMTIITGCASLSKDTKSVLPSDNTVTLDDAIKMVQASIVKLQKTNDNTGMVLSQATVQLNLTALKTDNLTTTLGVTLPFTVSASPSAGLQATTADQIVLTFQSYLTFPTTTVAGALYASTASSKQVATAVVTGNSPDTTTTTTTISTSNINNLDDFSRAIGITPTSATGQPLHLVPITELQHP